MMRKQKKIPDKDKVAIEILNYLNEHPDAQDTLEGINQFWLTEPYPTTLVEKSITKLIANDLIVAVETHKGGKIFGKHRANQQKKRK